MTAALFPLFADLRGRPVLVVGGGAAAEPQVRALKAAGARVQVLAPTLSPGLQHALAADGVAWQARRFTPAMLDPPCWLVVAASGDARLDRSIAEAAQARCVFCHVVDDAVLSSIQPAPPALPPPAGRLFAPSFTAGRRVASHLVASHVASPLRRGATAMTEAGGALVARLARFALPLLPRAPAAEAQGDFAQEAAGGAHAGIAGPREIAPGLSKTFPAPSSPGLAWTEGRRAPGENGARPARATPATGSVVLVGAGPGDPGLLTLAALHALGEADVILHDRLVSEAVLRLARPEAERIPVGKAAGGHSVAQSQIHHCLLEHARAGRRVVRLKGGDPFVFGRGGEELEFLRAHGIAYEVVPGITAALACAAYAGVPLTHRDHAQSVRLATAHCKDSLDTLDWPSLARERQTLALYMGVSGLELIQQRLLSAGRAADTPFALVENGSRPEQRVVAGPLGALSALARQHRIGSPALLIIGEVAALAGPLHWFGAAPLAEPGLSSPAAQRGASTLPHAA